MELLIWFGDSNYKHFAPTERYNRVDTERYLQRMTRLSSVFPGRRPNMCALLLLMLLASPACMTRSRVAISTNKPPEQAASLAQTTQAGANDQEPTSLQRTNQLININTAAAKELENLPGIGKGLAERIVEHREKYGPFRRTEHLISVRGISDRRFRALRGLIAVE